MRNLKIMIAAVLSTAIISVVGTLIGVYLAHAETLYALAKVPNLGMPAFVDGDGNPLPWHGYVKHARHGQWLLFSVSTETKAQALDIATSDPDLYPIGIRSKPNYPVPEETLTNINAWLTNNELPTIVLGTGGWDTLKAIKKAIRINGEIELNQERCVDPEDTE